MAPSSRPGVVHRRAEGGLRFVGPKAPVPTSHDLRRPDVRAFGPDAAGGKPGPTPWLGLAGSRGVADPRPATRDPREISDPRPRQDRDFEVIFFNCNINKYIGKYILSRHRFEPNYFYKAVKESTYHLDGDGSSSILWCS